MGIESEKNYIYIYLNESLCCTPATKQHCKLNMLQYKFWKGKLYIYIYNDIGITERTQVGQQE